MGLFSKKHHKDPYAQNIAHEEPWYRRPASVAKAIVLALLAAVLAAICFWGRPAHLPILLPGSTPKLRYDAQFAFTYKSKIKTEEKRKEAASGVVPFFIVNEAKSADALTWHRDFRKRFAAELPALRKLPAAKQEARCAQLIKTTVIKKKIRAPGVNTADTLAGGLVLLIKALPDDAQLLAVFDESFAKVNEILKNGIRDIERAGNSTFRGELNAVRDFRGANYQIALRTLESKTDPTRARQIREGLSTFFSPALQPNVDVDQKKTGEAEKVEMDKVPEQEVNVAAGEPLLLPDQKVTQEIYERWNAYRDAMTNRERFRAAPLKALEENAVVSIGGVLLVGLFLLLCPRLRARRRGVTLAALSVVANLLLIRGFLELGERPEVITYLGNDVFFWMAPMTLAAVITAILGGIPLAILATFIVSFFATLMLGRSIDIFLVFALASLTGVYCCRRVRDRGTLFRAGFWVGGVSAAGVFFVCLIGHELSWPFIGNALVLTAFSGFMTCIAIMVLVPILEKIFHTASDFTLGELSTDSDHPLLRKLRIVAPGTSNHSASVASLAEAGAEAIGANDLLCRCSALFHDIGKIAKPEYFSENQGAENPHDKVTPAMSAMVIREHVAGGVKLAKEYNLPREIIDIIEQHHGTDLIKYFYFKAKEAAAANGSEVDEQAFRYDGPRPSTREAAIVMIADGLEASVRALKNHTPTEIRERVNAIINDRIKDGQFDESPLTFRELDRVREAMYNSLLTSYHHRVEYPQDPRARKSEGN